MTPTIARRRSLAGLVTVAALLAGPGLRAQETSPKPQARAVLEGALAQAKATERLVFLHSGAHW